MYYRYYFSLLVFYFLVLQPSIGLSVTLSQPELGPQLTLGRTPSFVIADKGIRHQLEAFYSNPFDWWSDISQALPADDYRFQLLSSPPGLTLSPTGWLEWLPGSNLVGETAEVEFNAVVSREGLEIYEKTVTLNLKVIEAFPSLRAINPIVTYESSASLGMSGVIFDDYSLTDSDRQLCQWSLINPPAGVSISDTGYLSWPEDRGYASQIPYEFKIRVEYKTLSGPVFDEVVYRRHVLPEPAELNFRDFGTYIQPEASGMLGFSIDYADGIFVAGEPFPDFAWQGGGNPNFGRVRLWSFDGDYELETGFLQPQSGLPGQAFGASVAIAPSSGELPLRLVVGAPEAGRLQDNGSMLAQAGYVYVFRYESASQTWSQEARLDPPELGSLFNFGGWVAIEGRTLIASIDGADSAGTHTGALAVFEYLPLEGWQFSQQVLAPNPGWGDYFGYPCDIEGEWIAAAANEDDNGANNSGAVHLYQREQGRFNYMQTLKAPVPEEDALFGERLLLHGEWLFVSAFREKEAAGAVYVFRLEGEQWAYVQVLEAPFITSYSLFGFSLSVSDNVLAVAAPGYLASSPAEYGWKGITLFELKEGSWSWSRQTTTDPDSTPNRSTWGFSILQYDAHTTIASIPDYRAQVEGEYRPYAGRVFLHRWNLRRNDPFQAVLDLLSLEQGIAISPDDDSDDNGIPNLIEWAMGQNIADDSDSWGYFEPRARQSFIQSDSDGSGRRLMIPIIERGLGYKPVIEVSTDLREWSVADDARWEPLQTVRFPTPDQGDRLTYFHPVYIEAMQTEPAMMFRLKMKKRATSVDLPL